MRKKENWKLFEKNEKKMKVNSLTVMNPRVMLLEIERRRNQSRLEKKFKIRKRMLRLMMPNLQRKVRLSSKKFRKRMKLNLKPKKKRRKKRKRIQEIGTTMTIGKKKPII